MKRVETLVSEKLYPLYKDSESPVLPYETVSLCPECMQNIPATVKEEDGNVVMVKKCPEHGEFWDIYWSDVDLFNKASQWFMHGRLDNPRMQTKKGCPQDCGLCSNHKSHTALALLDVTNRCNLKCPICFANANAAGYIVEPSLEEIRKALQTVRENSPVPCPAIQFAGGEPTVRKDLPEIIRIAKELGFPHVEVASNGIRLAKDPSYAATLVEAGISTVYLQFDGVTPEPYVVARGRDLLPIKMKAIENCRKGNLNSIVLVPTVVRGVNDHQIGDIIQFAIENIDIVRGIVFQPVAFTGRIEKEKLREQRITIPDVIRLAGEQLEGKFEKDRDWFPCTTMAFMARMVEYYTGNPGVEFSTSPHCGYATYVFVDEDGEDWHPLGEWMNLNGFLGTIKKITENLCAGGRWNRFKARMRAIGLLRFVKKRGLLRKLIGGILKSGDYSALRDYSQRSLLISSMHFMDPYNFDINRCSRCCIHYVTIDQGVPRIIPFCTMNSIHREAIEKRNSVTVQEWLKSKKKKEEAEIMAVA